MTIKSPNTAVIHVVDRSDKVGKYALTLNDISRWVRVYRKDSAPNEQGRISNTGNVKPKSLTGPNAVTSREESTNKGAEPNWEKVEIRERSLDASRDYWQLRDNGQFGSYPSHDDFDD